MSTKLKAALGGEPKVKIKVKTSLTQSEVRAGEALTGVVRLFGEAPLKLRSVSVCLMTDYLEEGRIEDEEGEKGPDELHRVPVSMAPVEVSGPCDLGAEETREWPAGWLNGCGLIRDKNNGSANQTRPNRVLRMRT